MKLSLKKYATPKAESRCDDQLGDQHNDTGLDGTRRGLKADAGAHKQQDRGDDGIGATAAGSRKEAADLKTCGQKVLSKRPTIIG